jgi:ligand-binding sensor domain-containing protein
MKVIIRPLFVILFFSNCVMTDHKKEIIMSTTKPSKFEEDKVVSSDFGKAWATMNTTPPKSSINPTIKPEEHPKIVRTMGTQSEHVSCQLLDKDGNLWFSINGEGAYRYNGKSFTNFTTKNGLCSNNVGPIIQDKEGNILFGTKNGICKYDGQNFTKYSVTDTFSITCLLEDNDGNLWFGAMNKGVYRYDGKKLTNILYQYKHPKFGDKYEKMINDIMQDKKGNIWFCSWNRGGAWRYDGTILTHFLPSDDYYIYFEDERSNAYSSNVTKYVHSPDYITDDMIFSISEDRAGNIWFATRRHGACRYDGKSFTNFIDNDAFLSYGVHSILADKKGNTWFTTEKNGVYCYDGKKLTNYSTADGLVNNSVFSIIEDKDGNLWFGTRWGGLSRFDGKSFTTFSQNDN